jgi:hypothetical protein
MSAAAGTGAVAPSAAALAAATGAAVSGAAALASQPLAPQFVRLLRAVELRGRAVEATVQVRWPLLRMHRSLAVERLVAQGLLRRVGPGDAPGPGMIELTAAGRAVLAGEERSPAGRTGGGNAHKHHVR